MACIMGLRFAQAHILSENISGMTNLKVVGSKRRRINGIETFAQSPIRQVNLPRKVTPRWSMQSNWSRYFLNA